jgi:aryl-alcohol dehydrogenase-like predicted oxidoreductase
MHYRSLGKSGLKVSVIGLGTNQFGGKVDLGTTKEIIDAALDSGINLFDTADVYQSGRSEQFIAKALKAKRDRALIATKVRFKVGDGPNDFSASRQHILNGVEASLTKLQTDYIDLYQIHGWDGDTLVEETMVALDDLVRSGKVRYIGASNYASWQLVYSNAVAEKKDKTQFVSIQPHYHMLEREIEKDLVPACNYFGIGILPYFPLAGGFLTGKYKKGKPVPEGSRGQSSEYVQRYMTPENYEKVNKLNKFAMERDHTLNELAHAWLLANSAVSSVISGATKVEHIFMNSKAAMWDLSATDYDSICDLLDN